jgi:hypothetical protein
MEVHHHSHSASGGKKWSHYLWEFLMLFLAVTLGFFVENQREHYVEHQREKQFIQSLFNDLKKDTANLTRIINARNKKEYDLDSLSFLMNSDSSKQFIKQIYFYAVTASRTLYYRFVPNDGTMQQLKNSGAFRLIRKRNVVDSITTYDINVRNILSQWSVEENLIDHYRDASTKIFDGRVFDKMIDENAGIIGLPEGTPHMQPYSEREFYEWNYRLYGMKVINKGNRRDLKLLLKQAEILLVVLKKEYHLE